LLVSLVERYVLDVCIYLNPIVNVCKVFSFQ
jgi:hypothetical protein